MITHIPVRIDNDTFVLSVDQGRAFAAARSHYNGECEMLELLWLAPEWPDDTVVAVLETAGFSVEQPHRRVAS